MNFKNIDKKYRPIPFWSWNEKLDLAETGRQIDIMDKAGIGGYFMHARGGLQTPYMGDAWFSNVDVGISEGNKRNMEAWAYDENGWPSGFGNGAVNGKGIDYQQKYLRCDQVDKSDDHTIAVKNGYRFYYDVNPYYVDTLDIKVTKCFIEEIYNPYYERYKNTFKGFFTDEPQISRKGIPWSFVLPDEYKNEYGEELLDRLAELFYPVGDYENTRVKFWRLVTKLFSQNFLKPIYEWCIKHNLGFTGHLACEEHLGSQLTCNGACMPHYEYFTMPGMDWLGRNIRDCLTPLQVSSVAHQLGKKEVLSETFALCGHNVGFDEMKEIYQWQLVNGITKLCPHLEGYSLRGLRKRDYPPSMYYQQPWWNEYKFFVDAMSRIGMILSEGEVHFDTLLIHPQTTAWICFDGYDKSEVDRYDDEFFKASSLLNEKHILFHYGDEMIMERHARVDGNELVIGTQRYKTVVIPPHKMFFENTRRLLMEFEANGGTVTTADKLKGSEICDSPYITYTRRDFDKFHAMFFINNNNKEVTSSFSYGSKMLDITTGELLPFDGTYTFKPYDSLLLIEDGEPFCEKKDEKTILPLDISGKWNIKECELNTITLDTCDVYFDGELYGKNENVVDVIYLALEQKRSLKIRCDYSFSANTLPDEIYLICEVPEKYRIKVNGVDFQPVDVGYFADSSFRKLILGKYVHDGENVISFETDFNPTPEMFDNLDKALAFESEKNKLTFDVEFEAIYIAGRFSVKTSGDFSNLDKSCVRYRGSFVIDKQESRISLANIEQQGFPFFSGRITLEKTFELSKDNYGIFFEKKGVNAVNIKVNGVDMSPILWAPFEKDISDVIHEGTNTVEITLVNNLRNLLGPHHLICGETYFACPTQFYKRKCVWNNMQEPEWDDGYCFAEFGLENHR